MSQSCHAPRERLGQLTPREHEVLVLIGQGLSLPQIAAKLFRSLKTIQSHRQSLGRKLNAHNAVELARIAFAEGLVRDGAGQTLPAPPAAPPPATPAETLSPFSELLARNIAATLEAPHVLIANADRPDADHVRLLALWSGGRALPTHSTPVAHSPLRIALLERACILTQDARHLFPRDSLLVRLQANGFAAAALGRDAGGLAVIAVIHHHPLQRPRWTQRMLRTFARIAAQDETPLSPSDAAA